MASPVDRLLFADKRFRDFGLCLALYYLTVWVQLSSLPVLVALKFGAGTELIASLALRLIPRIIFAPVAGALIQRFGAKTTASISIATVSAVSLLIPWLDSMLLFQVSVIGLGLLDVFITPSLLSLRGRIIPEGRNMAANSFFQSADRTAKIIGPPLAGLMLYLVGAPAVFLLLAITSLMIAGLLWSRVSVDARPAAKGSGDSFVASVRHALSKGGELVRRDVILVAAIVPSMCYMVTLGATQPYLFWLNQDLFGGAPNLWTVLLAAQGVGALLGAILSGIYGPKLEARYSLLSIFLAASLLEGLSSLALLAAPGHVTAAILLIVGGIPEMLAYITYFSIIQKRLDEADQGYFYSLSLPFFDLFLAAGIMSGALYSSGILTINQFWLFATSFSILPVLPWFILLMRQSGGDDVQEKEEMV